jgi:hypothetical protein
MLYDPRVRPGMDRATVGGVLSEVAADVRARLR